MIRSTPRAGSALAAFLVLAFGRAVAQTPPPGLIVPDLTDAVVVETWILAVPPELAEKYLKGAASIRLDCKKRKDLFEDVQGNVHANVLHSLATTTTSGQRSVVRTVGTEKSAVELSVRATVSADRRSVRMDLKANLVPAQRPSIAVNPAAVEIEGLTPFRTSSPIAVNETFIAPDGQTVVFAAGTRSETVFETSKIPILGDLPMLGGLFTNDSSWEKKEHVLVVVAPRLLQRKPNPKQRQPQIGQ